jgi:hypothetical protein
MAQPQYANEKDLEVLAVQHEAWLDKLSTSHIQPLDDSWEQHPFWADSEDVSNPDTVPGKMMETMQSEFTPTERAESCKARAHALLLQSDAAIVPTQPEHNNRKERMSTLRQWQC